MPPGDAVVARAHATADGLNFPAQDVGGAPVLPVDLGPVTVPYIPGVGALLRSLDGRVEVQVPPDAADRPLTLAYSLLPGESNTVPPQVVGFKRGLPTFYLNASDVLGNEFHQFSKPLTITVSYTPEQLEALSITKEDLSLFWFDDSNPDNGLWLPIPTSVDTRNRKITASVDHFTGFAAAEDFRPSDQFIPSLKDWQIGLFKGNVNFDYDIEVPEGPAGIKPEVKLSYDSSQTDGPNGLKQKYQSTWVGKGWSLDTGYIAYNKLKPNSPLEASHFSMVLNWQSFDLIRSEPITSTPVLTDPTHYAWRTTNESFNRIRIVGNGNSTSQRGGYRNGDPLPRYKWQVWTKDGTLYEFEEDAWWGWSNCESDDIIEFADLQTYKWHLSKVKDTHDNIITYTYGRQTEAVSALCPEVTGISDYDVWPDTITWAGARTTGSSPRYKVEFVSVARTIDTDVEEPNNQLGNESIRETRQLEEILVKSNRSDPYNSNSWDLVRRYDLKFQDGTDWQNYLLSDASTCDSGEAVCGPITTTKKLTLRELRLFGTDNVTYMPPITFTYWLTRGTGTYPDGRWNRLWQVNNNQGGVATFNYETIASTMGTAIWAKHYKNNRRVMTRVLEDGMSATLPITWTYTYTDPAYNSLGTLLTSNDSGPNYYPTSASVYYNEYQDPNNRENNRALLVQKRNHEFRGHSYVKETDPNGNIAEHWFYQGNLGTQWNEGCYPIQNGKPMEGNAILSESTCFMPMRDREFLKGREWKTVRHQGTIGTNSKLSEVQHDFNVVFYEYGDSQTEWLTGQWRAFSYEQTTRNIAWEKGSTPITKTVEYVYDVTASGVVTYGNLLSTKDRDVTGAVMREITHTYNISDNLTTNTYIVDRKRSDGTKDGAGNWLALTFNAYDGSSSPNGTLTKGDLTLVRKYYDIPRQSQLPSAIHSADTTSGYDDYGNQITTTTYVGYGETTLSGGNFTWGAAGGGTAAKTQTTEYDPLFHTFGITVTEPITSLVERHFFDYQLGVMTKTVTYNNVETDYTYDKFGRSKSEIKYGDTVVTPTTWIDYHDWAFYDSGSPVKYVVNERELSGLNLYRPSATFYDGLGREIQTKKESKDLEQWIVVDKVYDGLDQVTQESQPRYITVTFGSDLFWEYTVPDLGSPDINWTRYQYDGAGRKTRVEAPDSNIVTTMQYAIIGSSQVVTNTDANSHITRHDSDVFGRLTAVREYSGTITDTYQLYATTGYGYDPLDLLTVVTDTNSKLITMQYDSLGRKTQMNDLAMGAWEYEYYPSGNIETQWDNNTNKRISFSYDAMDRLRGKDYPDENGNLAIYAYDEASGIYGLGLRTSITRTTTSGSVVTRWEYDQRGRTTKATHTVPDMPGTRVFGWTYDTADRVSTITYPPLEIDPQTTVTETIHYEFDAAWRQIEVCTDEDEYNDVCYANDLTYTALDQPTGWTLLNGLVQSQQYTTKMKRLERIKVGTTSNPGEVFNRAYTYQSVGNVQTITRYDSSNQVEETQNFEYDHRDRLTRWEVPDGQHTVDERYAYDTVGNLLQKDILENQTDNEIYDYYYDYSHAAGSGGPYATRIITETIGGSAHRNDYEYDDNGNVTDSEGPKNAREYDWNVENLPTTVTMGRGGGSGVTEDYLYDAEGERVKKTRVNTRTYYLEDLWEEQRQGQGNGATTVRVIYKLNGEVVAQREVHPNQVVPQNGLRGDYFNDPTVSNFQTTLFSSTVNFDWRTSTPDPAVQPEQFSVEWTGNITTTKQGEYAFSTYSDGGVKLWVNGQLVVDNWTGTTARTDTSSPVELDEATRYTIKLQFVDTVGGGQVQLKWLEPGDTISSVVPSANLSPPDADLYPPPDPNSDVVYFHTDHLGSISAVTDYMGAQGQWERQEFDPWGLVRDDPPGQSVNSTDRNYTGHILDGTDLVYMHARYYDPLIGRFVSADTIVPGVEDAKGGAAATIGAVLNHKLTVDFHEPDWVSAMKEEDDEQKEKQTEDADKKGSDSNQWGPANPQTLNRYAYALNNPVKYTDPTGHIFFLPLIAAAVVGFGSGVALDVGIDYISAEDKSKFDVGASAWRSATDPWTAAGAIPVLGWAGKGAKVASKGTKVLSKVTKCLNSFSVDTEVATAEGQQPIGSLQVGDWVLAYDEVSKTTGLYPITAVMVHEDPVIVYLTLDGELIETTPEHPFYTWGGEWVEAGKLWTGALIREADGEYGTVQSVRMVRRTQAMYNLTVKQAHTFFVGDGQWLVHNQCIGAVQDTAKTLSAHRLSGTEAKRLYRSGEGIHVFNANVDLAKLESKIWTQGMYGGVVRGHERFYYRSSTAIGRRIQRGGRITPLYYAEIKGRMRGGVWRYHLVPRSRPAR
ncbi:MAG: PA14 domain-containing protein [Chloroflexia bacterium]